LLSPFLPLADSYAWLITPLRYCLIIYAAAAAAADDVFACFSCYADYAES